MTTLTHGDTAVIYTCVHCGKAKSYSEMSALSTGWPSKCCRCCWNEFVERAHSGGWGLRFLRDEIVNGAEFKHDTEDKMWWVSEYEKWEEAFITVITPRLGIEAEINPAKKQDRYAPDLLVKRLGSQRLADLKCQTTPFFQARELYDLDPQYAVTFNRKDAERYEESYAQIEIYFWVTWRETYRQIGSRVYRVQPMTAVYVVDFEVMQRKIVARKVPLHSYRRRGEDRAGNARDSYIFDAASFTCLAERFGGKLDG